MKKHIFVATVLIVCVLGSGVAQQYSWTPCLS